MNKIHRIRWSAVRKTWVATSEISGSRGKSASLRKGIVGTVSSALMAALPLCAHAVPPAPDALPTGGQVVSGQASILQSGAQMSVNQTSNKAVLNWNTFNIGANAAVTFQQPSSSAVALNRVIGADPSAIYGKLSANGQVFLVNPNGVLFGQGARVDVGGLVASTLNISDANFLAGNNRFTRDGSTGSVINQGELMGKYVALLAPEVRNEGIIAAQEGTVALAAGDAVTLGITGNSLINVQVDAASINTLVENKQLVQAGAGTVIMSAQSATQLLGQVVNSGTVEANGITSDGGVIRLRGSSTIANSGTLSADAGANGKGGSITAIADLSNPSSLTTVDGILSAKGGSQSGDGGFIETSGHHLTIADTASITTTAANGKAGTWLLDPNDFTISPTGDITGAALSTALMSGNVTIQTAAGGVTCTGAACGSGTAGNGDIIVNDIVDWTTFPNTLTLEAFRDIHIMQPMSWDFLAPALLNINYGMGGTGKAYIDSGVSWTGAGTTVDLAHSVAVNAVDVDTTNPYWIGTVGISIYVQSVAGSSVYGNPATLTAGYFSDVAGANQININGTSQSGTATWTPSQANLAVGSYNFTYNGSLTSTLYSSLTAGTPNSAGLAAGTNPGNWTVTPRPITLTAGLQTKQQGTSLTLNPATFSITAGSYANTESATSVTMTSATGKAADTAVGPNTYIGEIVPSAASGINGFLATNYTITYQNGNLQVTAVPTTKPPADTSATTVVQTVQNHNYSTDHYIDYRPQYGYSYHFQTCNETHSCYQPYTIFHYKRNETSIALFRASSPQYADKLDTLALTVDERSDNGDDPEAGALFFNWSYDEVGTTYHDSDGGTTEN
ncbi:MAG: filamentous hemagglutinin N-terminal domain-containing protein [Sideroxydans sp.]|nr:filamentous hemagglutinin N-terminal domain-containing protein [Sideroxydans sp.]